MRVVPLAASLHLACPASQDLPAQADPPAPAAPVAVEPRGDAGGEGRVSTPSAPATPSTVPPPAPALDPAPAPTTAAFVADVAIALSDPECRIPRNNDLSLLCHDRMEAPWLVGAGDWDSKVPCIADGETVTTISTEGVAQWTVALNPDHPLASPTLTRAGGSAAAVPPGATVWLVMKQRSPAATARIERPQLNRPGKSAKALTSWVTRRLGEIKDDDLPVTGAKGLHEFRGRFGGGADTVVVFEIRTDDSDDEWSYDVGVLVGDGKPLDLVPLPLASTTTLVPYGVVDIDGDGIDEIVWWRQSVEVSDMFVSYFDGDKHAAHHVWGNSGSGYYMFMMTGRRRRCAL